VKTVASLWLDHAPTMGGTILVVSLSASILSFRAARSCACTARALSGRSESKGQTRNLQSPSFQQPVNRVRENSF